MNQEHARRIRRWTSASIFAAIIAAGSFISIPLPFSPVHITLQNLFVVLAGLIAGPLAGTLAVAVFLATGALGAPIFSGMRGGFSVIMGPTGGFLLGYLIAALVAGLIAGAPGDRDLQGNTAARVRRIVLAVLAGFLSMYIPGLLRLHAVIHPEPFFATAASAWKKTIAAGLLPFIPGMIFKIAIAIPTALRLRRFMAGSDRDND